MSEREDLDPFLFSRSWERPELTSVDRLPMTPFLRPPGDSVLDLDGTWDLTLRDRPGGAVISETAVEVPGCWTMQDVGDGPKYTNIQMPFPGPPPRVPDRNPTGTYHRRVDVPPAWVGRRVVLHVGGAETVLYVTVDGRTVGMGTDSRLDQEFDLTGHVRPGESFDLDLTVVRWGAATYLEDQDHWHHAGLHRSVFLYSTPPVYLADLHVMADRDPRTGDGSLDVRVHLGGDSPDATSDLPTGSLPEEAVIEVLLDGTPVGSTWVSRRQTEEFAAAYGYDGRAARIVAQVPDVAAWSAERPVLHDVTVRLLDKADGEILDERTLRSGFRRVEVVGHELLVNGRAVLLKGVNRHDHDPHRGKAVTRESIRRDLELMKAHHINAVRTSHYPNDPYLYEVCDEIGLYVVDEADIESHAHLRSLTKDPIWASAILERVTRMARRDKNHPCVIIWSLGNESGASPAFDAAATWLRSFDPTRPVQYESGHFEQAIEEMVPLVRAWRSERRDSDLVVPMYPAIELLEEYATAEEPARPLIMCEYEHAMNNSCGDLDRYWDTIRRLPGLQGGFLWDWVDQALYRQTPAGELLAYGGDFGDEPNDGPFCLNGLVSAEREPHPSLLELKAVLAPVRFAWDGEAVEITNEHEVTNLADVAPLTWAVTVDGAETAAGDLGPVDLPPGERTRIPVTLPPFTLDGWQVANVTFRVGDAGTAQFEIGRSSVRSPGPERRELPTRLALWRAPIDNETFGPAHAARWEAAGLPTAHERVELRTEVDGDQVTHEVTVPDDLDDIPRVGVRMDLPPEVVAVDWIGLGPHESYGDRCSSTLFGRWHTPVDDWPVRYVHPQANGNRHGVRSLRFLDAAGEVVLTIDEMEDLDVTVSRWTDEEVAAAKHLEDLPERDHAFVWIDARHRGVGSAAVGPDVSAEHRIGPGTYCWTYRIR
ncbi:MAG: hypothetical protein KDB02_05305 [Acidimicrobiales bacterium]|nr:hypothetical protein [Acidimicrobiales bacterium]